MTPPLRTVRPARRGAASPPPGYALRLLAWRTRRAAPALAAAVVAVVALRALAAPDGPTIEVVVLARDVVAGRPIERGDVRVAHVPPALVPDDAVRAVPAATGAEPLVDLRRGTPLVEGVLARGRFGVEPPPGSVVVPLELAGVTDLLRPGDRVDVVARSDAAAADEVLATGALVLSVERPGTTDSSLLGGAAPGPVVVVAVGPEDGRRLVARSAWDPLGAVLVP